LQEVIERHDPDVIGLQETKVADDQFPLQQIHSLGYDCAFHGQKGHYGVALLFRRAPLSCARGFPDDGEDSQRRLIKATFETRRGPVHIYNGYFPQGENRAHPTKFPAKEAFYRQLSATLRARHSPGELVVVMGDMNVAPEDVDIGIGEDNRKRWLRTGKCCFLPEERQWYAELSAWGLRDTFRERHGDRSLFSWFDYRSRGTRREACASTCCSPAPAFAKCSPTVVSTSISARWKGPPTTARCGRNSISDAPKQRWQPSAVPR
jgi:exodeoxyribonuclease-3